MDESEVNVGNEFGQKVTGACQEIVREHYMQQFCKSSGPARCTTRIRLNDMTPFYSPPRRLSFYEREIVSKTINELLSENVIRPSNSPYASTVVLVKKKDGKVRMCVDYRGLNKMTIRDNFPLPLIEDCLEYLEGKSVFTTIDLKNGFHHIGIEEESVKYTAFVTPDGQFEYLRMPFGLKNGPAVFQRFISDVLQDMVRARQVMVYMDDIILATRSVEEHYNILAKLLDRLVEYNLEVNFKKSEFMQRRIEYLGYDVSSQGISPSDQHLRVIKNYPEPYNCKTLHSCLGLFSYFRKFVQNFSRIAKPLTELLKKGGPFPLSEQEKYAFNTLKEALSSAPVLAIYNPSSETELHTDASSHGFGAVLMQRQSDNKLHPVFYYSRKATGAESRYHSFELETLAIIYALRRFRVYLEHRPFLIVTDCNSLVQTLNKKAINPRIARWSLELESYNFTIAHRPGSSMYHVDALSRQTELLEDLTGKTDDPCDFRTEKEVDRVEKLCDSATLYRPVRPYSEPLPCRTIEDLDEPLLLNASVVPCDGTNRVPSPSTIAMPESMVGVVGATPGDIDLLLQTEQSRDSELRALRENLEKKEVPGFELVDGIVYRSDLDRNLYLYAPSCMQEEVIRKCHEKLGHLAADKCIGKLKQSYWFPLMRSKVEKYIRNCLPCILHSVPRAIHNRTLHSIPKSPTPFDTVHIDHLGPLPSINSKRKHLLVTIDAFTKFVKLYPVNSTSTREVNAALEKYFEYYSRPRRIVSDRGTCFTSLEFSNFLESRNIEHIKVATAAPQANGQVERVNRVLTPMLGKLSEPLNQADWYKLVSRVEFALNNSIQCSTKKTPSILLFGCEQRGPVVDELTEYLEEKLGPDQPVVLETIRCQAGDNIRKSQEYNEAHYSLRHKAPLKYALGDFVAIRNVDVTSGVCKKFAPKYRGPYKVSRILPNDRYEIVDVDNCQLTQLPYKGILEPARLKPWIQVCNKIIKSC